MILVVDDSPVVRITLEEYLAPLGHPLVMARDGAEALGLLQNNPKRFFAVLLDRTMPGMDGIEVLKRIKNHDELKYLPVIMQTARHKKHEVLEGIHAGAYYYLIKPYSPDAVRLITNAAIADFMKFKSLAEEVENAKPDYSPADKSHYTFRTVEEAEILSKLLSRKCPEPQKTVIGLWELMLNAIEHGNLGISYQEKSDLLETGKWDEEIRRRYSMPQHSFKTGSIAVERTARRIKFHIKDQGKGFEWAPFLEISPERAFDAHGRGIAISKEKCFDGLEYMGKGNEVVAVVNLRPN